jgi:hypothetical protein
MADTYEYDNGPWVSIKGGQFYERVSLRCQERSFSLAIVTLLLVKSAISPNLRKEVPF